MKNKISGYVYIISAVKTDYFKIGVTKDSVIRRLGELQTGSPYKLRYVFHIDVESIFQVEKELHSRFISSRRIGEWFSFTTEQVQECISLMRLAQIKEAEDKESILDLEQFETLTVFNLDKSTAKKLILEFKNNLKLNQTKIIWTLWKAAPGDSLAYKKALEEYKDLINDI